MKKRKQSKGTEKKELRAKGIAQLAEDMNSTYEALDSDPALHKTWAW